MNETQIATFNPADLSQQMAGVPPEKAVIILMTLLEGITGFCLSSDMWYLAYLRAERQCGQLGISHAEFLKVKEAFNQFRVARKRRNPMACMHEAE